MKRGETKRERTVKAFDQHRHRLIALNDVYISLGEFTKERLLDRGTLGLGANAWPKSNGTIVSCLSLSARIQIERTFFVFASKRRIHELPYHFFRNLSITFIIYHVRNVMF